MRQALAQAEKAAILDEVPVGAVLVMDDTLIAAGHNLSISHHDATAHAEIQVIRAAGQALQNYRLPRSRLYVTLEPCPMCAGAIIHARIDEVVIATADPRTGSAGSVFQLLQAEQLNHRPQVRMGCLQQQASDQLTQFFQHKRAQQKQARQQQTTCCSFT